MGRGVQALAVEAGEASVLDEATLRALRAVHRAVPQGLGASGDALAGGVAVGPRDRIGDVAMAAGVDMPPAAAVASSPPLNSGGPEPAPTTGLPEVAAPAVAGDAAAPAMADPVEARHLSNGPPVRAAAPLPGPQASLGHDGAPAPPSGIAAVAAGLPTQPDLTQPGPAPPRVALRNAAPHAEPGTLESAPLGESTGNAAAAAAEPVQPAQLSPDAPVTQPTPQPPVAPEPSQPSPKVPAADTSPPPPATAEPVVAPARPPTDALPAEPPPQPPAMPEAPAEPTPPSTEAPIVEAPAQPPIEAAPQTTQPPLAAPATGPTPQPQAPEPEPLPAPEPEPLPAPEPEPPQPAAAPPATPPAETPALPPAVPEPTAEPAPRLPEAPVVGAAAADGVEDGSIALSLTAALADTDGSAVLTVCVVGLPPGAVLSAGSRQDDGSWVLAPADLPGLTLTPPRDFSGSLTLTLQATATDHDGGMVTRGADFTIEVAGVADAPEVTAAAATVEEDGSVALRIGAAALDADGSEHVAAFRLLDLPVGAALMAGGVVLVREPDGSVLVEAGLVQSLTLLPPTGSDAGFTLRVAAISVEANGSRAESAPVDLPVRVIAQADAPVWIRASGEGTEDTPIRLDLAAQLADTDGSETLYIVVSGLPAGASLDAGRYRGAGSWSLTLAEAEMVHLLPPRDFAGTLTLTATAVAQERNGGDQASRSVSVAVHVAAVVDTPAVGGMDGVSGDWGRATGNEDQPIALNLDPGLADHDGSERVVGDILVAGVPAGAVLRLADGSTVAAGVDGLYRIDAARAAGVTLTMPRDSDVAATLTLRMTIEDSGGVRHDIGGTLVVDPLGVADAPALAVTNAAGTGHVSTDSATGWIPVHIGAAATDTNGSETLDVWVRDVPAGSTLSAGIPAGNGLWLVPAESLATLGIRPPAGYAGSFTLRVEAVATEREGGAAARTSASLTVTVAAPASGGALADPDAGGTTTTAPAASSTTAGSLMTTGSGVRDLTGGSGNDTLYGHAGENRISGGAGDDVIRGYGDNTRSYGDGHDEVSGGTGNDTLVFGTLAELLNTRKIYGDAGVDTMRLLNGVNSIADADLNHDGNDVQGLERIEFQTTAAASLTIGGNFQNSFGAAASIEALSSAHFTLNGAASAQDLTVLTGGGADTLFAGSGRDVLDGGAGDDVISAGTGDDTIRGGAGSDKVDGGAGSDHVTYAGRRADYVVTALAGDAEGYAYSVRSANGSLDKLRNVEWLDFADSSGNAPATLAVAGVRLAQAPSLHVAAAATLEDARVALSISAALADTDGGRETLGLRIDGVPAGASLSAGARDQESGAWVLRPADLAALSLTPPPGFAGRIVLTVTAVSAEATGDVAHSSATLNVVVTAVADTAVITAAPDAAIEDMPVALNLRIVPGDADGSESVTAVLLSDLSPGARIAAGIGITDHGDGSWSVEPDHLDAVRLLLPADASGSVFLTVAATIREADGLSTHITARSIAVTVEASPDVPVIAAADGIGIEDTAIALDLGAALTDRDGSEALSVVLSGLPAGTWLSTGVNNGDGSWTLRPEELPGLTMQPPVNWSGTLTLHATALSMERSTGAAASASADFHVVVGAVADAPLLQVAPTLRGAEDGALPIDIAAQTLDGDGSEVLAVRIAGLPDGTTLSAGTALGGGAWALTPGDLPGLRLTPAPDWNGSATLTVEATSREVSTGATATSSSAVILSVAAVNDAPTLGLGPADGVAAGTAAVTAFDHATAADVDSAHLAGASITLDGGLAGDTLGVHGFSLGLVGGRMMVGDTGIEVLRGGYDSASATLLLSGSAAPATYAAVLEGLTLENANSAGLAAGTRSVAVVLRDELGAEAARQAVDVTVQAPSPQGEGHDQTLSSISTDDGSASPAGSGMLLDGAGADTSIFWTGGDVMDGASGRWTDAMPVGGAGASDGGAWTPVMDTGGIIGTTGQHAVLFDQAFSGQISFADQTYTDFPSSERITW